MRNKLIRHGNSIYRILDSKDNLICVIDCIKCTMPKWIRLEEVEDFTECTEQGLLEATNITLPDIETLDIPIQKQINERFGIIAEILPFVSEYKMRTEKINIASAAHNLSKQTVRNYLCLYLVYQNKAVFAPKQRVQDTELSQDEKNMRWALNKFFYTKNKNSLKTAYTFMLKNKYCDESGALVSKYPSFYQFRYFYRKTRNMQNYYISRDGIKSYQRNNRPLLGDGVQSFASSVGKGMLDSTICDIYLVSDTGEVIGRPVLTACVDAYSGMCCGYALAWEGGMYSLRELMLNIVSDKVEHCQKYGISITKTDWNCDSLPGELISDMGKEYTSNTFEQIVDLGVSLTNLPPYRPELKGVVEKFFDVIQNLYKPILKGKGVIEPDFQERGAHDYRKDACLTLKEFEKILLHCIIFYNSKRVLKDFPYSEEMLENKVHPYSNCIWNWCMERGTANLIQTDIQQLILTMLPRTQGKFTRYGLSVGKLHYRHDNYTEQYLLGGAATVAYNPDNAADVWLIENGHYIKFELIEERFANKSIADVESQYKMRNEIINGTLSESIQAQIDLSNHIEAIAATADKNVGNSIKNIRSTRKREKSMAHIDYVKVGEIYG